MASQNKHFLNTPASVVLDSLEGLCSVNPQLALDTEHKIVYIKSPDRSKVALLCGGGSGHEPAHAGFVGEGILTGAVCGNIFASPNASQVRRAIDIVDNDRGTVIIVTNYTGDILNFGLAREQYAALHTDRADRVKFVIVGDDVAVGKTQGSMVGRRGLAGTILVCKIAGALANRGGSLEQVYHIAQWVSANVATIGVGLEHGHVPGTVPSASYLSASEIEIGMGIHNESGHRRLSPIPPLTELIPHLLDLLTSTTDPERSFLPFQGGKGKDEVVLLVNNLGGVSELELGGIVAEVCRCLNRRGISCHRVFCGSFMTSLNMPGFSITLLLLPPTQTATQPSSEPSTALILSLLDETAEAPGWKWSSGSRPFTRSTSQVAAPTTRVVTGGKPSTVQLKSREPDLFLASIKRACENLIFAEPEITRMDTIAGDGDCGLTLKAGAEAVLGKITDGNINKDDLIGAVIVIAQVAEQEMGGTSGALYSIFFSALAQGLRTQSSINADKVVTPMLWAGALTSALGKLYTYTRARPPSRTLVDPLAAFIETLSKDPGSGFLDAVKAAAGAAEGTKNLEAKAGRSAYVDRDKLREYGVTDPGAWGVKVILESLGDSLNGGKE